MATFIRRYFQRTYRIEFYIRKFNPQNEWCDLFNELIDNLPVQETVVGCPIPVVFQLIVSPEILFFMMLKSNWYYLFNQKFISNAKNGMSQYWIIDDYVNCFQLNNLSSGF